MSSQDMSSREYWAEVQSLADSIAEEARADGEDPWDSRLHETIDGHQWIIYTAYNYEVLRHSDNDGYTVKNFGADCAVKDGALNTAALAYGALYADVAERLQDSIDALEEAEQEEACNTPES